MSTKEDKTTGADGCDVFHVKSEDNSEWFCFSDLMEKIDILNKNIEKLLEREKIK